MTELATPRSAPPERVPTLTEVLDPVPSRHAASGHAAISGDDELGQRLLSQAQARIDELLAQRLSARLEPLMQDLVKQVVGEVVETVRSELASTLREQLSLAMAQENSRHRSDVVSR